ncbi:hypothetical protein J5X84_31630 [Streptosporangiaceae bacterium NEAU-GS5]|nr:hypothetical protein [Streptosporangiaceae bacterium NEAU-GS5]
MPSRNLCPPGAGLGVGATALVTMVMQRPTAGTLNVPAGVSTVTARWTCGASQVYPGPYVTWCGVTSYSFS